MKSQKFLMAATKNKRIVKNTGKSTTARKNSPRRSRPELEIGREPFTQNEAIKLINSTESLEDRALLILGFNTGLKLTEIVKLEPINFEFNNGIVKIWDKKRRLYRTVYLTDDVINEIRLFIDTRKDSAGPRLFPYTARTIEGRFQRHTLRVLDRSRSWEAARRTYIAVSAKLDIPIKIVVENTGETATSVAKYYLDIPLQNTRRKVNDIPLYPEAPKLMLKSDELKRILEGPYVEKMDKIFADGNKVKASIADLER